MTMIEKRITWPALFDDCAFNMEVDGICQHSDHVDNRAAAAPVCNKDLCPRWASLEDAKRLYYADGVDEIISKWSDIVESRDAQIQSLKAGIKEVISEYGIGDALLETTREAEIIEALEELIKGA